MAISHESSLRSVRRLGHMFRTREALAAGIHPRTLYAMRNAGKLEQLARGVYRLAALPPLAEPDLAIIAKRVPQGVVCLISALSFHRLTTQIPHAVHLALARPARAPRLDYPPLQIYRFSEATFGAGVETHSIDGLRVRVYNPEKTLADCFKFRNKIGLDVAIEALKAYRRRRRARLQLVLEFARLCRVENVVRPYLEA